MAQLGFDPDQDDLQTVGERRVEVGEFELRLRGERRATAGPLVYVRLRLAAQLGLRFRIVHPGWALCDESEVAAALNSVRAPGMGVYVLGYYHGWRLLRPWLDGPDRRRRVRRLLTEQLLPAGLEAAAEPA